MSDFLEQIKSLILAGDILISEHGYDELADDDFSVREVIVGVQEAEIVAEYPDYGKGPCILLLQQDSKGSPIHVVWGIPKGYNRPVVLVTAYRPNPVRWDETFMRRLK